MPDSIDSSCRNSELSVPRWVLSDGSVTRDVSRAAEPTSAHIAVLCLMALQLQMALPFGD